jgi:hypothetical protein
MGWQKRSRQHGIEYDDDKDEDDYEEEWADKVEDGDNSEDREENEMDWGNYIGRDNGNYNNDIKLKNKWGWRNEINNNYIEYDETTEQLVYDNEDEDDDFFLKLSFDFCSWSRFFYIYNYFVLWRLCAP